MNNHLDFLARGIGYQSYSEYLHGDHWRNFRGLYLGKRCYCCLKEGCVLHLHHATYKNLGKELPGDVVTVCGDCHQKIHELVRGGANLRTAHVTVRQGGRRKKKKAKRKKWAGWRKLVNRSNGQTVAQLRILLHRLGLMENGSASRLAYRLKIVRVAAGKELWHFGLFTNHLKNCPERSNVSELEGCKR